MRVEQQIESMGLLLPPTPKPLAAYVPAVRTGNLVYCSGQLPMQAGVLRCQGRVGEAVTVADARHAAGIAALNGLAAIKSVIGDLDAISHIVRVTGYVSSRAGFTSQPEVVNGASELLLEVFGEAGRHSRVAVGVSELPLNACVEIDMIVEVSDER